MHPRERVLEEVKLLKERDQAIPTDLVARAEQLGLFISGIDDRHPTQTPNDDKKGVSQDGVKRKLPDI